MVGDSRESPNMNTTKKDGECIYDECIWCIIDKYVDLGFCSFFLRHGDVYGRRGVAGV